MNFIEILLVGIGLSMDAFAVAIAKGIGCKTINKKKCLLVGLVFGLFQALMPVLGYYVGYSMRNLVYAIDHYIVFAFLVIIGSNMIHEACCGEEKSYNSDITLKGLIIPGFATSIDAFSVGITFAFMKVKLAFSVITIGLTTFLISAFGTYIGNSIGNKFEKKAKFLGGIILIIIGVKTLIEHFI